MGDRAPFDDGEVRTRAARFDAWRARGQRKQKVWNYVGAGPLREGYYDEAAELLGVVAQPDRLELLALLAYSVRERDDLDGIALRVLERYGLVVGEENVGLTSLGREVWHSVRSLIR